MTTAVDTNVLLDLLIPDSPHNLSARRSLAAASEEGAIVVSEPVIAELAGQFDDHVSLQMFLDSTRLIHQPSNNRVLHSAGVAWREYTRRRDRALICPSCATSQTPSWCGCGSAPSVRQHLVSDFLIGAHALEYADQLLTRDRGYYQTYFPGLQLA